MAYPSAAIRTAIAEAMEGDLGTVQVDSGTFNYGVFDGQKDEAKQSRLVQTSIAEHWFDVQLGVHRTHQSSNVSTRTSRRLLVVPVTIPIYSHLKTEIQESERDAILASIASDCEDAVQVLAYPHTITATVAAVATDVVGGLVQDSEATAKRPEWFPREENWEKKWIRSEIVGAVVVAVASILITTQTVIANGASNPVIANTTSNDVVAGFGSG